MARTIARLQVAALDDPEFQALTPTAQWAYWVILQQRRLTLAGSLDYQPTRWAAASNHANPTMITGAVEELIAHRYVIVDPDTDELIIRTFVRHDLDASRLSAPTMKGFWSAWEGIYSTALQAAVIGGIDDDLWDRMLPHAPVEAVEIHDSLPTRAGTAVPAPTGTAAPVPTGTPVPAPDETCGKPQTSMSAPLEREPTPPPEREQPPPHEVPVTYHLPPVSIPSQVVSPTGLGTGPDDPTTTDDDQPPSITELAHQIAQARSTRLGGGHQPGWIRAVANGLGHDAIRQAVTDGHTDPTELDRILDGKSTTDPTTDPPVHPAVAATNRPHCDTCDGMGWIDNGDQAEACPDCSAVTA